MPGPRGAAERWRPSGVSIVDTPFAGNRTGRARLIGELLVLAPAAALTVVLALAAARRGWEIPDPGLAPWWLLCAAFVAAEAYFVTARGRLEATVLPPHEAAVAIGLFLLGPVALVGSQVAGAGVALLLLRQWRWDGFIRRLVVLGLGTSVAVWVFHAIGMLCDLSGKLGWGAVIAASLAGTLVAAMLGRLATYAGGLGVVEDDEPGRGTLLVAAGAVASTSLAIAAIELIRAERPGGWSGTGSSTARTHPATPARCRRRTAHRRCAATRGCAGPRPARSSDRRRA